jgi:hypothetical protein
MHPTVFLTKEVYRAVGNFNTSFKIAMDYEYMLRVKNAGFKFKHIDKVIANMRTDGVSSNIKKMFHEELLVKQQQLKGLTFLSSIIYSYLLRNYGRVSRSMSSVLKISSQIGAGEK